MNNIKHEQNVIKFIINQKEISVNYSYSLLNQINLM